MRFAGERRIDDERPSNGRGREHRGTLNGVVQVTSAQLEPGPACAEAAVTACGA